MSNVPFHKRFLFATKYAVFAFRENFICLLVYGIPYRMIWVELGLMILYPFVSPYRINLRYIHQKKLDHSYIFGETPLTTLEKICRWSGIPKGKVIFDVGCGWGRSTFFLHAYNKAHRTVGIDIVPEYIERANKIRSVMKLDYMVFLEADIRCVDYRDADIVYMYGTCFPNAFIQEMVDVWEEDLKEGAIILTTSYSLISFSTRGRIQLHTQKTFDFLWGDCTVYVHCIKDQEEIN